MSPRVLGLQTQTHAEHGTKPAPPGLDPPSCLRPTPSPALLPVLWAGARLGAIAEPLQPDMPRAGAAFMCCVFRQAYVLQLTHTHKKNIHRSKKMMLISSNFPLVKPDSG